MELQPHALYHVDHFLPFGLDMKRSNHQRAAQKSPAKNSSAPPQEKILKQKKGNHRSHGSFRIMKVRHVNSGGGGVGGVTPPKD